MRTLRAATSRGLLFRSNAPPTGLRSKYSGMTVADLRSSGSTTGTTCGRSARQELEGRAREKADASVSLAGDVRDRDYPLVWGLVISTFPTASRSVTARRGTSFYIALIAIAFFYSGMRAWQGRCAGTLGQLLP